MNALTTEIGPSRHFVAVQQFGSFRREADTDLDGARGSRLNDDEP